MWLVSTAELSHDILQDGRLLKYTSYCWENCHKNEFMLKDKN